MNKIEKPKRNWSNFFGVICILTALFFSCFQHSSSTVYIFLTVGFVFIFLDRLIELKIPGLFIRLSQKEARADELINCLEAKQKEFSAFMDKQIWDTSVIRLIQDIHSEAGISCLVQDNLHDFIKRYEPYFRERDRLIAENLEATNSSKLLEKFDKSLIFELIEHIKSPCKDTNFEELSKNLMLQGDFEIFCDRVRQILKNPKYMETKIGGLSKDYLFELIDKVLNKDQGVLNFFSLLKAKS